MADSPEGGTKINRNRNVQQMGGPQQAPPQQMDPRAQQQQMQQQSQQQMPMDPAVMESIRNKSKGMKNIFVSGIDLNNSFTIVCEK